MLEADFFNYMPNIIDLTGKKFGKLTVIKFSHKNKHRDLYWFCKCDCGKTKTIFGGSLKGGRSMSCGCLRVEFNIKHHKIHGMYKTKFYYIWQGIKRRCNNPNVERYSVYGGRGIKVCNRWLTFINFYDDMYKSYLEHCKQFGQKKTQIDRINNNGNYMPNNCKWSTPKEQANNRHKRNYLK